MTPPKPRVMESVAGPNPWEPAPFPAPPGYYSDPVAARTQWVPLRTAGGGEFRTHELAPTSPEQMEFVPKAGTFLMGLLLTVPLLVPILVVLSDPRPGWADLLLFVLVTPFVAVGVLILRSTRTRIVFDRARGLFWKGRSGPDGAGPPGPDVVVRLADVHALQMTSYYVLGGPQSHGFWFYELNLVLRDGSRRHVLTHGSGHRLREDALALGAFLGKPFWDGTGGTFPGRR